MVYKNADVPDMVSLWILYKNQIIEKERERERESSLDN